MHRFHEITLPDNDITRSSRRKPEKDGYLQPSRQDLLLTQKLWRNHRRGIGNRLIPLSGFLCSNCERVLATKHHRQIIQSHCSGIQTLVRSAETCYLCAYLESSLELGDLGDLSTWMNVLEEGSALHERFIGEDSISLVGRVNSDYMNDDMRWYSVIWYIPGGHSNFHWNGAEIGISRVKPGSFLIIGGYDTADSKADCAARPIWSSRNPIDYCERLATIGHWLKSCSDTHDRCKVQSTKLPRRIIDLGDADDTALPRLICPMESEGSYAALSYCWGSHVPLQTNKDTLRERLHAIDFSQTKMFEDAAGIVKSLGIRYLWIDALCILQDDEEDWSSEAARMAETYRNATLVLAASAANNCSERLWSPHIVSYPTGDETAWVRMIYPYAKLHDSPLALRAWTMQEELVARRVVYFSSPQVHWRCHECDDHEDGFFEYYRPTDTNIEIFGRWWQRSRDRSLRGGIPQDDIGREYLYKFWRDLVESYSHRRLTFEKDRAPALAGLTTAFCDLVEDEPLLGLWSRRLTADLCWRTRFLNEIGSSNSNLPSWSWTSTLGGVSYKLLHGDRGLGMGGEMEPVPQASLVDTSMKWTSIPMTSALEEAILIIRCRSVGVRLVVAEQPTIVATDTGLRLGIAHLDRSELELTEMTFVLLVTMASQFFQDSHIGLLLVPVVPSRSLYHRVGIVEVECRGHGLRRGNDFDLGPWKDSVERIIHLA